MSYRYPGDHPYRPQPNLRERIILAILIAVGIAILLGLIDFFSS